MKKLSLLLLAMLLLTACGQKENTEKETTDTSEEVFLNSGVAVSRPVKITLFNIAESFLTFLLCSQRWNEECRQ